MNVRIIVTKHRGQAPVWKTQYYLESYPSVKTKWEQRQCFRMVHIKETKKEEDAKGLAWTYKSRILGTKPGCFCSKTAWATG